MKEIIYKIRSGLLNTQWNSVEKIKILIETNDYFKKETWNNILNKSKYFNSFEINYFSNKYEGYKLIKNSQVLFSFGDNKYFSKENLKMQYYGVSQPCIFSDIIPKTYYAKGFSSQAIAEYCLTYSLIMINGYGKYFRNQFQYIWKQNSFNDLTRKSVSELSIGVLGLGNNGRKVSEIFRKIGCKVYGYDIADGNKDIVNVFCHNFEELLNESDILIATVTLTPETKNLFNSESLSKMKKSSFLINVSRGDIINENDLYSVLRENKIAGAVLDVTVNEPLSKYSKLWSLDNLIITPHISGNINKYYLEVMHDFSEKLNLFMDKMYV